jgi:hypothetical protein
MCPTSDGLQPRACSTDYEQLQNLTSAFFRIDPDLMRLRWLIQ